MAKQLYEGRHRIKERAGLKIGKKQNRGAPYLLVLHNSGCRRLKAKVFYAVSAHRMKKTCKIEWTLNSVHGGGVGLENPPKYIAIKSVKF